MATAKTKPCPDCGFTYSHEATCIGAVRVSTLTPDEKQVWLTAFSLLTHPDDPPAANLFRRLVDADQAVRDLRAHIADPNSPSLLKNPKLKDPS